MPTDVSNIIHVYPYYDVFISSHIFVSNVLQLDTFYLLLNIICTYLWNAVMDIHFININKSLI